MAEIKEGAKAPNVQATTDAGEPFNLQDLKGKYVAVYFYPKADTPG